MCRTDGQALDSPSTEQVAQESTDDLCVSSEPKRPGGGAERLEAAEDAAVLIFEVNPPTLIHAADQVIVKAHRIVGLKNGT
jgi:hypothetical protein